MLDGYHQEIKDNVLSKCLFPGDKVIVRDEKLGNLEGIFKWLPEVHCGRLGGPGVEPGIYTDRTRAVVEIEGKTFSYPISDVNLETCVFEKRLAALQQREPTWYLISWASDFLRDLPDTPIIEGDVVRLIDKTHEHYSDDIDSNQYTVNRIKFGEVGSGDLKYKLRAGSVWFDVDESQIELCSDGPVRLFYEGEGYKLRWGRIDGQQAAKAEAEFYLLLGRYSRHYNHSCNSYYWGLEEAREALTAGIAQAILQKPEGYCLVSFWDSDIGQKITYYPELVLDI